MSRNSPDSCRPQWPPPVSWYGVGGIPVVATPCASTCLATHHESAVGTRDNGSDSDSLPSTVVTHKSVSLGQELCVGPIPLLRAPEGPGSPAIAPSAGTIDTWNGVPTELAYCSCRVGGKEVGQDHACYQRVSDASRAHCCCGGRKRGYIRSSPVFCRGLCDVARSCERVL